MREIRRWRVGAAALAIALGALAVRTGLPAANSALPSHAFIAGVARDEPSAPPTRSYGMGFFVTPSVPTVDATIAFVPKVANVSDYAMIQREVPWTRILAGDSFDKIIDDEYVGLVNYLRGNGLKLVILVDPLDGLNRRDEAQEAVKNHVTLLDASTRATHEAWVKALVARLKPEYVGLASEINTLAAHGDMQLYKDIRDMANDLAPQLRQISPATRIFVSFQVDDAWGNPPFPSSPLDQFALTRDFHVDAIGLSSYPGFVFSSPAEIPANYFQRFADASGKPLLMAEGGWGSAGGPHNSPANEAAFYSRLFDLLDGVHAELAIFLLYNDLDLSDPRWGLTPDRAAVLANFASMGIVDTAGNPKPAYSVWQQHFARARE